MGKYDEIPERNMLLLLKRTVRIDGKRFLRLVCLDIEQGSIALLADHNGRPEEGLHSWNSDIAAVKEMDVIRAKYVEFRAETLISNGISLIVSRFEIVARQADMMSFALKMAGLKMREMIEDKTKSLEEADYEPEEEGVSKEKRMIPAFPSIWADIYFNDRLFDSIEKSSLGKYTLIEFENELLTDKAPTLWNTKVKITDERFPSTKFENKYFTGMMLLYVFYDSQKHKNNICAERLFGWFDDYEADPLNYHSLVDQMEKELRSIQVPSIEDYSEVFPDAWDNEVEPVYGDADDLTYANDWSRSYDNIVERMVEEEERRTELVSEIVTREEQLEEDVSTLVHNLEYLMSREPEYIVSDPKANDFATNYETVERPKEEYASGVWPFSDGTPLPSGFAEIDDDMPF